MPVPHYNTKSSSSSSSSWLQVDTARPNHKAMPIAKMRSGSSPHRQFKAKSSPSSSRQHSDKSRAYNGADDSSVSSGSERETVLDKLRTNLSRFTRSGNRRMMLRTLQNNKTLSAIPILQPNVWQPSSPEEWSMLEQAVGQTVPINLNGMLIGAASSGSPEASPESVAREGKKFLQLLRLLCQRLAIGLQQSSAENSEHPTLTAVELYHCVLQRLAKEPSETTVMDAIRPILATPELELAVPAYKKTHVAVKPIPTLLTLYVADGYAHCTVQHVHQLGLFRRNQDAPSRPFCSLTAKSHERTNLTTDKGIQHVSVNVLEDKLMALYG